MSGAQTLLSLLVLWIASAIWFDFLEMTDLGEQSGFTECKAVHAPVRLMHCAEDEGLNHLAFPMQHTDSASVIKSSHCVQAITIFVKWICAFLSKFYILICVVFSQRLCFCKISRTLLIISLKSTLWPLIACEILPCCFESCLWRQGSLFNNYFLLLCSTSVAAQIFPHFCHFLRFHRLKIYRT